MHPPMLSAYSGNDRSSEARLAVGIYMELFGPPDPNRRYSIAAALFALMVLAGVYGRRQSACRNSASASRSAASE
jgi:hypothetical protein